MKYFLLAATDDVLACLNEVEVRSRDFRQSA